VLANCFVNRYEFNSTYSDELEIKIDKYIPEIFKKEIKIPLYYINLIKEILNK